MNNHCIKCGSNKVLSRSLCSSCYQKEIESKCKSDKKGISNPTFELTKEFLINEYVNNCKSLADIGMQVGCSRQFVFKKMKEFNIALRGKSASRNLALDQKKLLFTRNDENGKRDVILEKQIINDSFFSNWSEEMAYVLGVIFTDGNIIPPPRSDPNYKGTSYSYRLTIAQNDKDFLQDLLSVMNFQCKVLFRKEKSYNGIKSGSLYYFHANSEIIYHDLTKLGVTPNKSLISKFPEIPNRYLSHFIRGCWDGDGSIFLEGTPPRICCSFVSGSIDFMNGMRDALRILGLGDRPVTKSRNAYYIKFYGSLCEHFYLTCYKDAPEKLFLKRKKEILEKYFCHK